MNATFTQAKPDGAILVRGDKTSGQLIYRDYNDALWAVPNIWYNQPREWRVEYAVFCRDRAAARLAKVEADKYSNPYQIAGARMALVTAERTVEELRG